MPTVTESDAARDDAARTSDAPSESATPKHTSGGEGRAVVTLTPTAANATRRMATQMGGISTADVVRRGLILLDLLLSLSENEELVVRRKDTGEIERLRFAWETF